MPESPDFSLGFTVLHKVEQETKQEFPGFQIIDKKKSRLMLAIDAILRFITFGSMTDFLEKFVTTIGTTVYVPNSWYHWSSYVQAAVLRHERVHMRQRKNLGALRYALTYLFYPVPAVFAMGRRDLEMEAYAETLRAYADYYGLEALRRSEHRRHTVENFVGPAYFWMWPFRASIERWYDETVASIEKETTKNSSTRRPDVQAQA